MPSAFHPTATGSVQVRNERVRETSTSHCTFVFFQPSVNRLKSGTWKRKQSPRMSNPNTIAHRWLGPLTVKPCLLASPTIRFEYSKFDHVKRIPHTTIEDRNGTARLLRPAVLVFYGRLILVFLLLLFTSDKEKKKE